MREYNEGDLVRATKGTEKLEGIISLSRGGIPTGIPNFRSGFHHHFPEDLKRDGFTITVIERAKPALPHGTLLFATGHVARWRDDILGWSITGSDRAWGDPQEIVRLFGSDFTILEPVAETAKKVLAEIESHWEPGQERIFSYAAAHAIAEKFGVQS